MPTAVLKPHWFHILIALGAGEQHGAGIVRSVLAESGGTIRLWPVMLQTALAAMTADGLIEPIDTPEGQSERRRYYRLTAAGRRAATTEADRLAAVAQRARLALRRRDV